MKYLLPLSIDQFQSYLRQMVSVYNCYQLQYNSPENDQFKLFYRSKAIFIEGNIVPCEAGSEMTLRATSPICVISTRFEEKLVSSFAFELQSVCQYQRQQGMLVRLDGSDRPEQHETTCEAS